MKSIKLIRTIGKEYIIGEFDPSTNICKKARSVELMPSRDLSGLAVALLPINLFDKSNDTIKLDPSVIIQVIDEDIPSDLLNHYNSEISGIKIVSNVNFNLK